MYYYLVYQLSPMSSYESTTGSFYEQDRLIETVLSDNIYYMV